MEYPEEAIVETTKGKEVRILKSKGQDFIVYRYFSLERKEFEKKYSILLKKGNEVEHLFIVPTKSGKALVVKHKTEKPGKAIYDEKTKQLIYF